MCLSVCRQFFNSAEKKIFTEGVFSNRLSETVNHGFQRLMLVINVRDTSNKMWSPFKRFHVPKHPLITFVSSSSISKTGENIYNVTGNLTIKGVSTELILPLRYEGMKDYPFLKGSDVVGFNGQLSLDRLTYAVGDGKYYKMGAVGKDVDILVTIEALREK